MAGRSQQIQYYRPYDSADESGSDSDASSADSWFSQGMDQQSPPRGSNADGIPNFRAFATQIQLRDAAARNFSTVQDQLAYGKDRLGKRTVYSQFDAPTPDLSGEDRFGRTRFGTSDGNVNTLVMVDSRYRDRQAYPQPTLFTLRLPRIYKQVTNITLSDLKLLTSFYFFRNSKGNTDITVYEKDRTTLTYEGIIQSTIVKRFITTGSYNIDSLLQEVQLQLNYTPLFFDYINGFDDFIGLFRASGDFSLNFNKPGDFFFNNTTNLWVPNPTVDTITLHFWKNRYAGLTTYSVNQVLLAYYYPVLNEYLYDENFSSTALNLQAGIGIDATITSTEQVIQRILYNFTGISPPDPVVLAVIQANRPELDRYRLIHTFRYWLINKYVVGRDTRSQNVYITSPSLNTSLVNLLNSQQALFLSRALQIQNLTARQYAAIQDDVNRSLAVLQSMYTYEQTQFLTYFGVPWSQYTLSYYANLNNSILLRNGIDAIGIPSNDSEAVDAGIIPQSNDILTTQNENPIYYWPNLSSLSNASSQPASTIALVNLSSVSTSMSSYQYVYSMDQSNFLLNQTIVNPTTNYLYSEFLTQSGNAACPIYAGKYTVFKFRSPVRQTMQVETLPRPTIYRVPEYNRANFDSNINAYFDLSYNYYFTSNDPYVPKDPNYTLAYDNLPSTNLFQIPGWSPQDAQLASPTFSWGKTYVSSSAAYTQNLTIDILSYNRSLYATFTTPQYSSIQANSSFTYSMNLATAFYPTASNLSTLVRPVQPFRLFFYHDRAAFQGDVLMNRNENPKFYKFSTIISDVSGTLQFTTYPNQQYYICIRADSSNFGTGHVQVVPYFNSSFQVTQQTLSIDGINPETDIARPDFDTLIQTNFNYAQLYDSNWIRLPTDSNLWPPDPTGTPINQEFVLSNVPIGYDANGVSTDYTDYVPYILNSSTFSYFPSSNLGIDPITKYQFQSNSPYNTSTNTFLYADGLNAVFTPGLEDLYSPSVVENRQFKIVHYYSPTYIPDSTSNFPLASTLISPLNVDQQPYTISTTNASTIGGYAYAGQSSTIELEYGPLGFSFIPEEGVWDLKRLVFRTAIQDFDNDPNRVIRYLAVYNFGTILNAETTSLSMSTAITVLSNTARVSYTSSFTIENNGYDTKGGTYYEFQKDRGFIPQVSTVLLGYAQVVGQMSRQPESMYTCIAFDEYGTPTPIKALSGSAVPYPYYNNAIPASTYIDGTPAPNSNQGVIIPSTIGPTAFPFVGSLSTLFAPPSGILSETQSKHVLSMPIGTSVLPIKEGVPIASTFHMFPWTTQMTPTAVVATVSNYILLQDTNINIYKYEGLPTNRTFDTPAWQLTADQIFPPFEFTALMGITGNSQYMYFLGFSNDSAGFYRMRFKRYNPYLGVLYEYTTDGSFKVPEGGTFKGFVVDDAEHIVVSYQDPTNTTKLYYNLQPSTSMISQTVPGQSTATISICPLSSTLYWMPLDSSNKGKTLFQWPLSPSSAFPGTEYTPTGPSLPASWSFLTVNCAAAIPSPQDRIWLVSQDSGYESNIYYSSEWNTLAQTLSMEQVGTSITNTSNQGQPITSLATGYNGGFWLTAQDQPRIWGNRNTTPDLQGTIGSAWQIFYPWQKIVLEKIANTYNPIVDTNYVNYPEYPHTAMFYYRDGAKFTADTTSKWGLESSNNFTVADTNLSGYYFNSYIFNVPLVKSVGPTDFQYLTVRGYTPTENSETLIRFNLPNLYSFGYATQLDMITEISLYSTNQTLFNSNYGYILSNFDIAFQQSNSFFGQGLLPNFDGSNFNTSNFQGFASNVSTIYAGYQSNANLISSITGYVNSNIQTYISTQLRYIIPASAQGRANYLDPIIFSLLWKSGLLPQYRDLLEDWGLGYNLGYAKADTPFSTYHRASSFYKILEDYIFLRFNPEYQLNRMDNTFRENFKITRDSTGQVQNFHGKLLLNNFNTFSQTFIFNNQPFNPPIGRLDQLYFQWVNIVGDQIDNNDCEWSATCVISESRSSATTASTIPALPPMPPIRK